jgi:hypothetical protein
LSAFGRSAALGAIERPSNDAAPNRGEGAAPTAAADNRRSVAAGIVGHRVAMAELGSGQVVDGDEVLAWTDSRGSENEREPPR